MATGPNTLKEFLEVTINPRRVDERLKMYDQWKDGSWFEKADILTSDSNIRQVLYGAPYFSWMNYHSDLWKLIPKRPAPDRHGFRILTVGGATSGTATSGTYAHGQFETDTIASATKATFITVYYNMKWMLGSLGISEKALYESGKDDAIDVWNANRTHMAEQHVTNIDLYLARNVNFTTRSTVVIDSLDRQISGSAEGTFLASGSFNSYSGATAAYIYPWGDNVHRTASGAGYGNGEFDAVVDENAGTLRSLSLDMLDGVIRQVRLNGKDTSRNFVIITGEDTADLISAKLEAKQRFPDVGRVQVGVNGVQRVSETAVGGGFDALLYKGIPILTSKAVYRNRAAEGTANPAGGYSRIYGVDLDSFYISVGMPTIFMETGREHWLLLDKLRKKALIATAAELVGTRWNTSFKIRDITA